MKNIERWCFAITFMVVYAAFVSSLYKIESLKKEAGYDSSGHRTFPAENRAYWSAVKGCEPPTWPGAQIVYVKEKTNAEACDCVDCRCRVCDCGSQHAD